MVKENNMTESIGRLRILVVDDDPAMLEVTVLLLGQKGYIVTPATGGREAIALLEKNQGIYDVILTDYYMPIINGIELASIIRELAINIPVVLYTTGKIDFLDQRIMDRSGVSGFAQKPCLISELDSAIKEIVSSNADYKNSMSIHQ